MQSIDILNQEIDDEEGVYRILFQDTVRYLTISAEIFDELTLCRPYLLLPKLPELPTNEWNKASITRPSKEEPLVVTTSNDPLPSVETIWHHVQVDVLSLEQTKRHRSNVHEVLYNGVPAISKIASWDWEIPRLERETWAYSILDQDHLQPEEWISPRVLGHLTENGRVVGLLLERLEGEFASLEDLPSCERTLRLLHGMGLVHGDVNRYNFIVNKQTGRVSLVDFEHAAALDEASAKEELESLPLELAEETGRGGTITTMQ